MVKMTFRKHFICRNVDGLNCSGRLKKRILLAILRSGSLLRYDVVVSWMTTSCGLVKWCNVPLVDMGEFGIL